MADLLLNIYIGKISIFSGTLLRILLGKLDNICESVHGCERDRDTKIKK